MPGSDLETWGNVLNDFLAQALNGDGTLKTHGHNEVDVSGLVADLANKSPIGHTHVGSGDRLANPTGNVTTDTATLTGLTAGSHQLGPGTYIVNPITLGTDYVMLRGDPNKRTTIQLVSQAGGVNQPIFNVTGKNIYLEDIILDGNGSTIGSGNYWSGVIMVNPGADDFTLMKCRVQNSARSGVYAFGYTGTQVYNMRIERCEFTNIGRTGAGNGGAGIMLDGGINDYVIEENRAYGTLSSNFLKVKVNTSVNCVGGRVVNNNLDFRSCTTFDATNSALGLEFWNGAYNTRVTDNQVYGPNTIPTTGHFWGISFGDARGSVCSSNEVIGGTNIQAMEYGLEVGECPSITLTNNYVANCIYGSNFTNNNPLPSHSIIITGNTYENCYENAIVSDSSPSAFKITSCTFIDCGIAYLFFNSINAGGGDGTVRDGIVSACTFQVRNQTRLHAEGAIFGIYLLGSDSTRIARVTIADCNFGPYPGGTSSIGMQPIEINNPRGVKVHHCNFDGARPDTVTANAVRAINGYCGDLHVDHCTAVNFTTEFAFTSPPAAAPLSTFEFNTLGTLAISSSANGPNTVIYWSTADGRLHVRNSAGTDAAVGP